MPDESRVIVTDVNIGFFRLMFLLVKIALAAIPAAIIVSLAILALSGIVILEGSLLSAIG